MRESSAPGGWPTPPRRARMERAGWLTHPAVRGLPRLWHGRSEFGRSHPAFRLSGGMAVSGCSGLGGIDLESKSRDERQLGRAGVSPAAQVDLWAAESTADSTPRLGDSAGRPRSPRAAARGARARQLPRDVWPRRVGSAPRLAERMGHPCACRSVSGRADGRAPCAYPVARGMAGPPSYFAVPIQRLQPPAPAGSPPALNGRDGPAAGVQPGGMLRLRSFARAALSGRG